MDDYESKETLLRKHLRLLEQTRGPRNRSVLDLKSSLGSFMWNHHRDLPSAASKQLAHEGGSLMIESYEMQMKLYGKESALTVDTAFRLAKYYYGTKQLSKSESLYRLAFEGLRTRLGAESPEVLNVECQLAMCIESQNRRKEALETLRRIAVIQKRQLHESPDRIVLSLYSISNGFFTALALIGLNEMEAALETLRQDSIKPLLLLPEISKKARGIQIFYNKGRWLDNLLRDGILRSRTKYWVSVTGIPSHFKELEHFFPLEAPIKAPITKLRRVKSWYLASA